MAQAAGKLRELNEEKEDVEKQKVELDTKVHKSQAQIEHLTGTNGQLQRALQDTEQLLSGNVSRANLLEKEVREDAQTIARLREQSARNDKAAGTAHTLESQLISMRASNAAEKAAEEKLKAQLAKKAKQASFVQAERDAAKQHYGATKQQVLLLSTEVASLKSQLDALREKNDKVIHANKVLQQVEDSETGHTQQVEETAREEEEKRKAVEKELAQKSASLRTMSARLAALERGKKDSAEHLNQYYEENSRLTQQYDDMERDLEAETSKRQQAEKQLAAVTDELVRSKKVEQRDEANAHAVWENDAQKIQALEKENTELEHALHAARENLKHVAQNVKQTGDAARQRSAAKQRQHDARQAEKHDSRRHAVKQNAAEGAAQHTSGGNKVVNRHVSRVETNHHAQRDSVEHGSRLAGRRIAERKEERKSGHVRRQTHLGVGRHAESLHSSGTAHVRQHAQDGRVQHVREGREQHVQERREQNAQKRPEHMKHVQRQGEHDQHHGEDKWYAGHVHQEQNLRREGGRGQKMIHTASQRQKQMQPVRKHRQGHSRLPRRRNPNPSAESKRVSEEAAAMKAASELWKQKQLQELTDMKSELGS